MSEACGFWAPRRQTGAIVLGFAAAAALYGYLGHTEAQPHRSVHSQTQRENRTQTARICDNLTQLKGALSPTEYQTALDSTKTVLPGGYLVKVDSFGNKIVCLPPEPAKVTGVTDTLTTTTAYPYDRPSDKLSEIEWGVGGALGLTGVLLMAPYPRYDFDGPVEFPAEETIS